MRDGATTEMAEGRARPFLAGLLAVAPLQVATIPFGMIFGVLAAEAGLDFAQMLALSATVMAGASSVVALQMLTDHAPALLIILSSAIVNVRMAMYSAALVPHWTGAGTVSRAIAGYTLTDQVFAVSIRAYEAGTTPSLTARIWFFMGTSAGCLPTWASSSVAGYLLGNAIPESWGIAVAMPLLFLGLAAPMVRTPAHMLAMTVAAASGILLSGLPNGSGLIPATLLGIAAGMLWRRSRWSR